MECFSAFYVIGVELKVKADNFRKLLVFYWNSFLENAIILAYYFIYCLLCKFFDRKIVCRMGEIFMMSKEQFLVIFYQTQKRILKDSAYWYKDIIRTNGEEL